MRWPGIRDGIRRQEFFKGEGTTNTTRHHATPGRVEARQRGHSGTTQGGNRQHPQRPRRTMTISVHGGRHKIRTDKTRPDDKAGALRRSRTGGRDVASQAASIDRSGR
jgi:hypothetical protein